MMLKESGHCVRHVVSPPSCRTWFSAFCSAPLDQVHYVGERDEDEPAILSLLSDLRSELIMFHSSHRSLSRDLRLAVELARRGLTVLGPTARAVELGLDKLAMKRFFAAASIPSPSAPTLGSGTWVVKRRDGTEGIGMSLVAGSAPPVDERHYVERYVEGEECSVVIFRDRSRTVVFPPVWKGRSNPALLPPYRRMRCCPGPPNLLEHEPRMIQISRTISASVPCEGWLEVELVLGPDDEPLVLEINPRVSGTMRLAAMAAGVKIFDVATELELAGQLPARAHGVEVPWEGPPVVQPERNVFATGRLTVARPTRAEAIAELNRLLDQRLRPSVSRKGNSLVLP